MTEVKGPSLLPPPPLSFSRDAPPQASSCAAPAAKHDAPLLASIQYWKSADVRADGFTKATTGANEFRHACQLLGVFRRQEFLVACPDAKFPEPQQTQIPIKKGWYWNVLYFLHKEINAITPLAHNGCLSCAVVASKELAAREGGVVVHNELYQHYHRIQPSGARKAFLPPWSLGFQKTTTCSRWSGKANRGADLHENRASHGFSEGSSERVCGLGSVAPQGVMVSAHAPTP